MSIESRNPRSGNNSLTIGLALITGMGLVLLVLAAGIGVIQGDTADNDTLGLLFMSGAALLIAGSAAWMGVVRPWESFDDINVPNDTDHHGEHHEEEQVLAIPAETTH